MNISTHEQRILHALAQGGAIQFERTTNAKVREIFFLTRKGHVLADCSLKLFDRGGSSNRKMDNPTALHGLAFAP
ncbi:YjhX family toxin [uncultured Ruegeria sp.]|uniref:YjhX family toxin n=1 Tax=uncultured Ruegeria sp. TaxID=259304 RepID=UPI002639BA37|nr:YjhX family toxin [uncultured Ruegeria sp.]